MDLVASCAFGLEAIVERELKSLGLPGRITDPGQVEFRGGWSEVCQANLWLRCADRVSILLAQTPCRDFDVLFDTAKAIGWEQWLPPDAAIHVTGGTVKSQLTSVPAIQRTVKRAIVDRLLAHGAAALPEDGPTFRIHVSIRSDTLRLTLDTTGPSLHKRGYRDIATKAPLKETLAAALVQLSFWDLDRPLIDPFCGGGTILIEAALLGRQIAPGLARQFASETWPSVPEGIWEEVRTAARCQAAGPLPQRLLGTDIHAGALSLARRNAQRAGVDDDIHFQQQPFSELSSKREFGCLITNPPYGDRLNPVELRQLYESIPVVLRGLPTWSHFILTAYPDFEQLIGKEANRRRKLYNGRIECTYFQFHGPPPAKQIRPSSHAEGLTDWTPVFGGLGAKASEQAELFAARLRKRARHLRRWPTRRGITCYRIYERDIPEIPLIVDRYHEHLHIVEFERPHDRDLAQHADWLELLASTAARELDVPLDQVFMKSRRRQRGLKQHERITDAGYEIVVQEGGLNFIVNLSDYADTGLFLDHRTARGMIRDMCQGKRVLNLFAYTGAFSVYAAAGEAEQVTSVDASSTYLRWAQRNMQLNVDESAIDRFPFVRADAVEYVDTLPAGIRFDVIICDPPTFSNNKGRDRAWQVERDHAPLLKQLMSKLADDGVIFFSSNFRRFKLGTEDLPGAKIREITKQTLPEDFRNQRIHRSWLIWREK